ncbi:MAG: phosphopantetheine adenylyltransferase [Betaproteobacteria bacterium]
MRILIGVMLLIAGAIHLLPLTGIFGAAQLEKLYGLSFADANLAVLMRHRAVLFGLLGGLMVTAAFRPELQPAAIIAGLVSVTTFLWLAWPVGQFSAQVARIWNADVIALVCLVIASGAWLVLPVASRQST